jgi:hypothetical protein
MDTPTTGYILKDGEGISVASRISRKDVHKIELPLPMTTKARIDTLLEGGALSGAIVGLVMFGLDELEKQGKRLIVTKD